jgi:hypothetical protein
MILSVSVLEHKTFAACEQSRLLQCKRAGPGPDVNAFGLRRQGRRRMGRLETRRHTACRYNTIIKSFLATVIYEPF